MWYRRRGKFNNVKVQYEGRQYDSIAESNVARYLRLLQQSGEVVQIRYQVPFELYGKNGTKVCKHLVDFMVDWKDGRSEAVECKSPATKTPTWRLKLKLMNDNYPNIPYQIVCNGVWEYAYGSRTIDKDDSSRGKGRVRTRRAVRPVGR